MYNCVDFNIIMDVRIKRHIINVNSHTQTHR